MSQTFSYATFGNGIVAILSGLVSSFVAGKIRVLILLNNHLSDTFGYVAPFMLALGLLLSGSVIVFILWSENYGDSTADVSGTFGNAISALQAGKLNLFKTSLKLLARFQSGDSWTSSVIIRGFYVHVCIYVDTSIARGRR